MGKTILVAIDGSASSSNSLDYLARLFGADSNPFHPSCQRSSFGR
jgi:hypothetical protein